MKFDCIKKLADKQYDAADWNNVFSDWAKESNDYLKIDYEWFHSCLTEAYKFGFEDGYLTAKDCPQDEFGNFIEDENENT